MKNQELNFTTVATKLSKADKAKLYLIADEMGLTFYQLIQGMFLCLLRYFDKDTPISYEHNILLNAFGNIFLSFDKDTFCPISRIGTSKDFITKAIVFCKRESKKGEQLLMLTKNDEGQLLENFNLDTMLENLLLFIDKDLLKALQREKQVRGYFSLSQTLHDIVLEKSASAKDENKEEIEMMFDDVRTSLGEEINEDVYYKRILNKKIDGIEHTNITPAKNMHLVEL